MRPVIIFAAVLAVILFSGCATQQPATQAYHVNAHGDVSTATRSASDGINAPGSQEVFGIFVPDFFGTGFTAKASITWDGMPTTVVIPTGSSQVGYSAASGDLCSPQVQSDPCAPQVQYAPQPRAGVMVPVPRLVPYTAPCQ